MCLDLTGAKVTTTDLCLTIRHLPNLRDLGFQSMFKSSRADCFKELRAVIRERRGSTRPFRHLVYSDGLKGKFRHSDESDAWFALVDTANWHRLRMGAEPEWSGLNSRLDACFGRCDHDDGLTMEDR